MAFRTSNALKDARSDTNGVNAKESARQTAKQTRDTARDEFRADYRSVVTEVGETLADDGPRWYHFGLSRPIDGDQPGIPMQVRVTAIGGGKVLVQIAGARRANSFNYYRKIVGTDPDPVKVKNTKSTTLVIESLPVGATVEVTVTGVNQTGEGQPCTPISVTVI